VCARTQHHGMHTVTDLCAQVRDERRKDYDAARGGVGRQHQVKLTTQHAIVAAVIALQQ
jgi:hypothetical protein